MIAAIDAARDAGDTMGGAFEVIAHGVPPGLGSHVQWDRKLDGRLAQALMSIPAIKAVGIGRGPAVASLPGSRIHDEILPPEGIYHPSGIALSRPTNNAGGLEGGITNGEDLRVTGYMKPIATLMKPLRSVDLATMEVSPAAVERSDVCAVPAAAVVAEAMVAIVLADAAMENSAAIRSKSCSRTGAPSAPARRRRSHRLATQATPEMIPIPNTTTCRTASPGPLRSSPGRFNGSSTTWSKPCTPRRASAWRRRRSACRSGSSSSISPPDATRTASS